MRAQAGRRVAFGDKTLECIAGKEDDMSETAPVIDALLTELADLDPLCAADWKDYR